MSSGLSRYSGIKFFFLHNIIRQKKNSRKLPIYHSNRLVSRYMMKRLRSHGPAPPCCSRVQTEIMPVHWCRSGSNHWTTAMGSPEDRRAFLASDGFEHHSTSCHSITKELILQWCWYLARQPWLHRWWLPSALELRVFSSVLSRTKIMPSFIRAGPSSIAPQVGEALPVNA